MKKKKLPQTSNKSFNFYVTLFFISTIVFWGGYHLSVWFEGQELFGDIFATLIVSVSLLGAFLSYQRSKVWGFTKSYMGLSLIFVSLALLMWAVGEFFYFLDSKSTTPSNIYDFFFMFIDPFYLLAVYFMSKAIGTLDGILKNLNLLLLSALILVLNYIAICLIRNQDIFTSFTNLDIDTFYIVGSVLLSTYVVSILLFSKKLGGMYKTALQVILIGLLCQYFADNLFELFITEKNNGSLADLIFFMSISFVTYGVLMLNPDSLNEKRN